MNPGTTTSYTVISLLLLLLLLLGAGGMAGCSHQVLTFFFTGVPEPGQEGAAKTEVSAARSEDTEIVLKNPNFAHGPSFRPA